VRSASEGEICSAARKVIDWCEDQGIYVVAYFARGYTPDVAYLNGNVKRGKRVDSLLLRGHRFAAVWEDGTAWRAWVKDGSWRQVGFVELRRELERVGA
jgi:predicted dehydrogenase